MVRRTATKREVPTVGLAASLNLGPTSARWLEEIGIRTLGDVERTGAVEIYRLLRNLGYPASLNLVYALEGAMLGVRWDKLPASVKSDLRRQVATVRGGGR